MRFPQILAVLACGMLFGFGLALSTMVQPEVVELPAVAGLRLMLVMGGAHGHAAGLLPRAALARAAAIERSFATTWR
jgi:hypothetical protein